MLAASSRLAQAAWLATGDAAADLRGKVAAEAAALAEADRRGWPDPVPLSAAPGGARVPAVGAAGLARRVRRVPRRGHPDPRRPRRVPRPRRAVGRRRREGLGARPGVDRTDLPVRGGRAAARQPQVRGVPRDDRAPAGCRAHPDRRRPPASSPRRVIRRKIAEADADKTARAAETAAASLDSDKQDRRAHRRRRGPPRTRQRRRPRRAVPVRRRHHHRAARLAARRARRPVRRPVSPRERFSPSPPGATPAPRTSASSSPPTPGKPSASTGMGRPPEHIDAATLTLGICTQPGVLNRLGDTPEFREQGLLARLLYAVPESRLGYRNPTPRPHAARRPRPLQRHRRPPSRCP